MNLNRVDPNHFKWPLFLNLCTNYLKENWPSDFKGTLSQTKKTYEALLLKQSKEPSRFFFLAEIGNEIVGLSIVYLESTQDCLWINIAEFSILESKRRAHLGTQFYQQILTWSKLQGAQGIKAEVDISFNQANYFWKSLGLSKSIIDGRNLYSLKF